MKAEMSSEETTEREAQRNWAKVQQAAQEASEPQDKHKRAARKLLNKIQMWGTQAQGKQWEQPVGIWQHRQKEEQALPWVFGGVEAEVKAFLTPELQQPGGDRKLYMAAKEAAKEAARSTDWPAVLGAGVDVQESTDVMEEHMVLLCKEAVGTVAAATEHGAQEGLREAVTNIAQLVAAESKGRQLQEAAAEAAYLRAAVIWHSRHRSNDGLMAGDAKRVRQQRKADRSRQGRAQQEVAEARKANVGLQSFMDQKEGQHKARQEGKRKRREAFKARRHKRREAVPRVVDTVKEQLRVATAIAKSGEGSGMWAPVGVSQRWNMAGGQRHREGLRMAHKKT